MKNQSEEKTLRPPQHQSQQPGLQTEMRPQPQSEKPAYKGSNKLKDKVAIITGGDSGIGRAVAIAFAKEGAHSVIVYLDEDADAEETKRQVQEEDRRCLLIAGNVGDERFCQDVITRTLDEFERIDILVNNAAVQYPQDDLRNISIEQLEKTFRTNIFSYFFMTQATLPHLKAGSAIINTTSVTAYRGSPHLVDYAATKGAIVAFTRSLALNLADKKIRVNAVAPGPIWTPLIPASFEADDVDDFGSDVPMARAGEPAEVAPCFVFLASEDASYMTGQVLHPNGGEIING
jgi:NAD(P)-dependent dehydrogenase (short-subunit alcohol dehydrogenase family)